MTIEEAITQLKDLRKDIESFEKNDEPDSVFAHDIEAIDIAVKALEENAELKRVLRLAVEDIKSCSFCNICANNNDESKCKKCKVVTLDMFQWKHADEAMKLIGDEENV